MLSAIGTHMAQRVFQDRQKRIGRRSVDTKLGNVPK